MSVETSRTIARQFREDLFNTGKLEIADKICDSQTLIHTHDPVTPDFGRGAQALRQIVSMYRTAFPDSQCTIDETVIQGDVIAARWTARGTNTGSLGNNAPTGRKVMVTGVDLLKISNGKIVECHVIWDAAGMLQQLGLAQTLKASA
ncbi:MAG TPA: ester cyclase [Blastocatellia bacterium]|nr:ester cyclase [Blastocatellia bacterium]